MDNREEDYNLIEQGLKSGNRQDRKQAHIAKERISAESNEVREVRKDLVDAHRSGDRGKIDDIHRRLESENKRVKEQVERYYGGRSF